MTPKRSERDGDSGIIARESNQTAVAAESVRAGADAAKAAAKTPEEGMSLFWRVFGGTILSICALVAITLYNNVTGNIAELRAEIARVNEYRAELVKKDEFNTRLSTSYTRLQDLQAQNNNQNATITSLRTELDGFKERLTRHAADVDGLKKETGTIIDGLKRDLNAIDALKDRVNGLVADAKTAREEYLTLRADVNKNQAYDQERKSRRDEQYKEVEKTLKEMQAAITACQVKLARLEGETSAAKKPAEKAGPPKPDTSDEK